MTSSTPRMMRQIGHVGDDQADGDDDGEDEIAGHGCVRLSRVRIAAF